MYTLSLEISKTIQKTTKSGTPRTQYSTSLPKSIQPAILRSKSLPNNSAINFEQGTISGISAIVNLKNGKKIYDHKQYLPDLPRSDEKAEKTDAEANTFISTDVINQVIHLVDNLPLDTPSYLELPESNAD